LPQADLVLIQKEQKVCKQPSALYCKILDSRSEAGMTPYVLYHRYHNSNNGHHRRRRDFHRRCARLY
jgi:hypothetical protein